MTRVRKVFTFSNVVAFVALFVALGGSVYAAGKISGTQIKSGSVPGNRIKSKSLTGKQIKPGSLTGAQFKADSLGATQINESTLTGVSASNLALVQYASVTVALSTTSSTGTPGAASCPPGTYVTGGGVTLSNEQFAFINDSGPSPVRTGWTATGFAFEPGITMTVTAICTAVKAIG
jgi:hypothetical protein